MYFFNNNLTCPQLQTSGCTKLTEVQKMFLERVITMVWPAAKQSKASRTLSETNLLHPEHGSASASQPPSSSALQVPRFMAFYGRHIYIKVTKY